MWGLIDVMENYVSAVDAKLVVMGSQHLTSNDFNYGKGLVTGTTHGGGGGQAIGAMFRVPLLDFHEPGPHRTREYKLRGRLDQRWAMSSPC